ncbi:MAG TPA: GntR family transcriptional regulator [Pseudonocardia sp.]|nr:GntR family transcriptional regulator [Pseudonocardia sp.]
MTAPGAPDRSALLLARSANAPSPQLSARQRVHALLRARIVSLELPPGTALSENELAAELQVSRTPVRESLILLADEALTEIYPRLGTFVSRIRLEAVAEAQFVREAIELAGLRQSVPRVREDDVADLRALLAAQREAVGEPGAGRFFELDEAFHQRLLEISGHMTAWKVVNTAKAHLDRARRLSLPMPEIVSAMVDQHEQVVDRLAAGDGDGAEEALRTHLRAVLHDMDEIRRLNPWYFADAGPGTREAR